jgi:hypothetical protein
MSRIIVVVAGSKTEFMLIVCRSGMLEGRARFSVSSHVPFETAKFLTM